MYKVVRRFREKNHDGYVYNVGDDYPKQGEKATKARLDELSTKNNKYEEIYIEEVKKVPKVKE
ncbi:hypothetical protein [Paenibacillus antarcticus]|uniref:Termination factor Rho n=1 Tax=Paenibacillus antarcticus TaxID=253703 RepID=A0A168R1E1_9BACL|nr:hypothetical protein [Paenibacillus antarcticus]OAB48464.1 hypothetical protein PBAT_02195 [Paenibacillus antarcticus]